MNSSAWSQCTLGQLFKVSAQTFIISSGAVQKTMLEHIARMRMADRVPVVTVEEQGVKRSIPQNSLIYALYDDIQGQQEGETAQTVMRYCKLTIGVPILRAEDEQFRSFYDKSVRMTLTYEEKLEAMDFLPVTRLMTKAQGTDYIDQIIRHYSANGIYIKASEYE